MNILFLHRSFPAQFQFIASTLAQDSKNNVVFITNNDNIEIAGIKKLVYKVEDVEITDPTSYLNGYQSAVLHGQAAAEVAINLKKEGFKPDIIYGHSGWGPTLFMKDVFPDVPLLCYFEWFANAEGSDTGFDGTPINEYQRGGLRCANSQILVDLYSCDAGLSPTNWQKSQFPKEYHDKIKVIHDGVDTEFYKPNSDAKFVIRDKNIELSAKDEVITYATRGMEPYRGFPEFMKAVEKLLIKRPNAHFVIAGEDKVCYRGPLAEGTYKELMLKELNIDLNRVHFAGGLPYGEYLKLMQISSAHVYLTVPYVLSWSTLDAMSVGCCVVASNTQPVQEVIKDNYNGLLFDFYNIEQQVEKIEYALDNKDKMTKIRNNARKTIVENYALKDLLPKHIKYLNELIRLKP